MFKETHKDIGIIREGKKRDITFEYEGEELKIISFSASCGCTKPKFKDNKVIITFKAPKVPDHVRYKGSYISTKRVYLHTHKGGVDLSFKVKVII